MCIVHISDFSTLKIHKICLVNWICFKFVRKLELSFFYYSYKFLVCILLLIDAMILLMRKIGCVNYAHFCKSGHIYVHGNHIQNYCAVDRYVEFRTDSSSDSVSIALPIIDAFVISMRHSLSWVFVTSTMNRVIFLECNKIMCALKT